MKIKNKKIIILAKTSVILGIILASDFVTKENIPKTTNSLFQHYSLSTVYSVYGSNFQRPKIEHLKINTNNNTTKDLVSLQITSSNVYNVTEEAEQINDVPSKSSLHFVSNGTDNSLLDRSSINKSTSYLNCNGKTTAAIADYSDIFDRTGTKGELIGQFTATAYDTSYGEYSTATGVSVSSKSLEDIKIIAVDPKVIPLMSKVYLEFPAPYEYLNGVYMAADTGGKIKQNIIDIFWGDFGSSTPQSLWDFGRRDGINIYTVK